MIEVGSSSTTVARGGDQREDNADRIWGADPIVLHDLAWASNCVQVVRPGGRVRRDGPALYLLLREHQLARFPLEPALKKMHWAAPRLLRMRILTHEPNEYAESVEVHDGVVRFRRSYRRRVRRSDRAWITADSGIAQTWTVTTRGASGVRSLRASVARDSVAPLVIEGECHDARQPEDVNRWLTGLVGAWQAPNAVVPDVYEYQPGVWVHAEASISESARLFGPAWIGSGRHVESDSIVVGPVVLPDVRMPSESPRARSVDWNLVRSPHWSLPSLARAGNVRRFAKRAFDIAFSLAVLLATLPIYIPVLLAIYKEDGRPVFFAHQRQTLGGKDFPCLKFRTMRKDAEKMKAKLMAANAADGPQFFIEDDPRVTRVGRLLRKYQIDELPQFINVLLGHMSVVGPRPSPDKENQYCPTWREARLSVRPGVTGLWQVRRTREPQTDFQEWIRYDLEYVQHQSFVGDLGIIVDTVRHIMKSASKSREDEG